MNNPACGRRVHVLCVLLAALPLGAACSGTEALADQSPARGAATIARFATETTSALNTFWRARFAESGYAFTAPRVVSVNGAVRTECGAADAGSFFYCPADQTIYYSLPALEQMAKKSAASTSTSGAETVAIVLAHEYGHHVRHLLERMPGIRKARPVSNREVASANVFKELEADCLSGAFARDMMKAGRFASNYLPEVNATISQLGDDAALNACVAEVKKVYSEQSREFGELYNKCLEGTQNNQDQQHGVAGIRQFAFSDGFFDHEGHPHAGVLMCGPFVNGWLARGPKARVDASYCPAQTQRRPRDMSQMKAFYSRKDWPLMQQFILPIWNMPGVNHAVPLYSDIFCVEDRAPQRLDRALLERFIGRYQMDRTVTWGILTVSRRTGDSLLLTIPRDAPKGIPIYPQSDRSFFTRPEDVPSVFQGRDIQVTFQLDGRGRVTTIALTAPSGEFGTGRRIEP